MTPVHADQDLTAARRRLHTAIARLINPTGIYVGGYREAPGLYLQLLDALAGQQGTGNGRAARSMPPLWVDGADTLNNIDLMVSIWQPGYTGVRPTVARLRLIDDRKWSVEQAKSVLQMAKVVNAWAEDIEVLLNPQPKWSLPNPCPACNTAVVHRRDSSGDLVRQPALQLGPNGCQCQNCRYVWEPARFRILAGAIGCPLPEGVLE